MTRAFNFNAGPATLPFAVLEKAKESWLDFNGTGMALMELSHRSKDYEQVHNQAISSLRKLLSISDEYDVLFLQGGASLQFSMIPMNLLNQQGTANYVLTGAWSDKALKEAKKVGKTHVAATTKETGYNRIPELNEINPSEDAAYLHLTSNNTIYGTQWQQYPDTKLPLIADMSSDILSRPIPTDQFDLIYAGAQKNLGPSGVTVVIIRKELIQNQPALPTMLSYETYAKNNSLYNTPPTLAIYLLSLVLEWVEEIGGLDAISKQNEEKSSLLYNLIDDSNGFYIGHADIESRSKMNVTFNLKNEALSTKFLEEAKQAGFVGLNGHRSVGGCRASIYNAVPLEHVEALGSFMKKFKEKN